MNLFVGYGHMLDAVGNDDKLALADDRFMGAELHAQRAFHHQKELVFVIVMMPDERAFQFYRFYREIVDFAEDVGIEVILEFREFIRQIHRMHGVLTIRGWLLRLRAKPAGWSRDWWFPNRCGADSRCRTLAPSASRFRQSTV